MKKTKETSVVITDSKPVVAEPVKKENLSIEMLLSQAVDKGVPVETMERLLAMRRELKAEYAREEYDRAMARFQSECPIINKGTTVNDKTGKKRYNYAKLENIVSQVKEFITKNGFSYRFDEERDEKFITALCIVKHEAGHSEKTPFTVEIGNEDYMTNVQKYGARMTFAKRYAFCNAFGILTMDEDNDGNDEDKVVPSGPKIANGFDMLMKVISRATLEQLKDVQNKLESSEKYSPNEKDYAINAVKERIKELKK